MGPEVQSCLATRVRHSRAPCVGCVQPPIVGVLQPLLRHAGGWGWPPNGRGPSRSSCWALVGRAIAQLAGRPSQSAGWAGLHQGTPTDTNRLDGAFQNCTHQPALAR